MTMHHTTTYWSTAAFEVSPDTSPMELDVLRVHVQRCARHRFHAEPLRSAMRGLLRFCRSRLITSGIVFMLMLMILISIAT